ncbi:acyltransferase [Paenibacillus contaminans]|uniref:Acyltransferase n=1 Tax=Paenibacillus contaminans TaxID=450362 RepID=A0A329LU29_9BACL|nr:acyltransferase [Paenibacillus contaminans]RAV11234.1 acyltransferase [Paenibacillus contaminans]
MGKGRIAELDFVRAVAILAVLLIHGTADATVEIPFGSRSQIVFLLINKLSNFAVPVFLMISALVMFYRYEAGWNGREAFNFYRKRLQYVIVPYLIWMFFYYVFYQWLGNNRDLSAISIDWLDFAKKLQWADVGYHLYFIVIIAQFYLVFPIIMSLVKAFAWFRRYLWLVGIVIQGGVYSYHHWVNPFEHSGTLVTTYAAVICIGGWIGLHYDKFRSASRHLWWVFGLAMLFGYSLFNIFVLIRTNISFGAVAYEVVFHGYAIFMGISLLWIGRKVMEGYTRLAKWIVSFSAASFGIYLIHPALLSYWKVRLVYPGDSIAYQVSAIASTIMLLIVPWIIIALIKKIKGSWILLGR